jgi:hypothetical protein
LLDSSNEDFVMQTSIVIHVVSPPSTAVTFTAAAAQFPAPVTKGTVLGTLAVQPATWAGSMTVSGPDVAFVGTSASAVAGSFNVIALADLTQARDYNVTVTAAP